uniref:Hypoxanthine-guanine phosphoribosyltransferase n=1 Tax=Ganoderma boninense TaxID=34458 RepID=A0A5K1K341_9APHY|nr:Hypoxanthine-guanine phosphoribosyltransferase [Ganoderma boninense]
MQAGPMNMTVTFLSPVEPDDWVKQSIPFSYLSVEAQSLDGKSYPVQLYSDITAEWESGDRTSSVVQWSNGNTGSSIYHEVSLQNPRQNVEIANQAQDGTTYYAMSTSQPGISWQIDLAATARDGFQTNGKLTNTEWTSFATIQPNFSVFAFAVDLGTIQSTASPVIWSVGYVRNPSITYTTPGGAVQQRKPYYMTQYNSVEDVIDAFTGDYAAAYNRAIALDQKIMNDATKISSQYSDIVSLATRQAMGTFDITAGTDSNGNFIAGDVKVFMKNLGTDQRINPVEHIYAAFPMFLYLNASIGGALLQPLLEAQANLTGRSFAASDIGNLYPVAPGSDADPTKGVEQSGNMLVMALAYARISGDGTLLSQYYNTTKRWADYLVSTALNSTNQSSMDGDTTNSANTALKGIIGVKAMAEIAHALGQDSDAVQYGNQASSMLSSWLSLASSSGGSHLLGSYGSQQSWSLMYNLFAEKLLGLNFVAQPVIDMQTQFLSSLFATTPEFGLPIDSESGTVGNAAWTMFASAFVSDDNVRDNLIQSVYNHANFNLTTGVFPETYNTTDNSIKNGGASPALGGMFAHLALT